MTEEQTYYGLTYQLDERQLTVECGWLLGLVCARVEQVCRSILPPAVVANLRAETHVRGIVALARLTDNTLGEGALRQLLAGQLTVPTSRAYLRQELVNLLAVEEALANRGDEAPSPLTTSELLSLHATLLRTLPEHGGPPAGALRRENQPFRRYPGVAPTEIAPHLECLEAWLAELQEPLRSSFGHGGAILRALLAHRYLLWIRPFPSANGQVARLVEQGLLRRAGIPATVALLLPIHYALTRSAYRARLSEPPGAAAEGHDVGNDEDEGSGSTFAFLRYALQGFADGLAELINLMDELHLSIHWASHVKSVMGDIERTSSERKAQIMAAISTRESTIKREDISQLSPAIASAYAQLTDRTLRRDIHDLLQAGLLAESKAGLRARKELLYAFLYDVQEARAP